MKNEYDRQSIIKFVRQPLFKVNELLNDISQSTSIVTRDVYPMIGVLSYGFSVINGKPYHILSCDKFFVEFAFVI